MKSVAASHAKGKIYTDKLFVTGMAAKKAAEQYGSENVIDASLGAIADDDGKLVCLPTVEKLFRSIPIQEIVSYSPVGGLPAYREGVIEHVFGDSRPDAHIRTVATAGGAGALSNAIWNYSNVGDAVLTHDWFWTPYQTICNEVGRELATFPLFNEQNGFNTNALSEKVKELLEKQDHLVTILNTPNHNPTGYSMTDEEWDSVLAILKDEVKDSSKKITLVVDIAYLDFTEDPQKARRFMKKFGNLPDNLLVLIAFSMSKSFTVYGQRTGALIGISSNQEVIDEFENIILVTGRARWSNINRGCMNVFIAIHKDEELLNQVNKERDSYKNLIKERAEVFIDEAKAIGLDILPYQGGFFITVPCEQAEKVTDELQKNHIFIGPMSKGIRVAACSVPVRQMKGLAKKIKDTIDRANGSINI